MCFLNILRRRVATLNPKYLFNRGDNSREPRYLSSTTSQLFIKCINACITSVYTGSVSSEVTLSSLLALSRWKGVLHFVLFAKEVRLNVQLNLLLSNSLVLLMLLTPTQNSLSSEVRELWLLEN